MTLPKKRQAQGHFEREAKLMAAFLIAPLVAAPILGVVIGLAFGLFGGGR